MTPKQSHQRNDAGPDAFGEVEALPDALRDMLLSPGPRGKKRVEDLPGVPKYPRHKNGEDVPASPARGALTKRQKQVLCQIAAAAYEVQRKHGLIDEAVKVDAWRRAEQLAAVGVTSLTQCRQAHYLHLKGHFEALAGKADVEAFAMMTAAADDPDRQLVSRLIKEEIERFAELVEDNQGKKMGWHRAEAYARTIAKSRGYIGPDTIDSIRQTWPVAKLWTLLYTLRNRTNAKRRVGDTADRNKGQRAPRRRGGDR